MREGEWKEEEKRGVDEQEESTSFDWMQSGLDNKWGEGTSKGADEDKDDWKSKSESKSEESFS